MGAAEPVSAREPWLEPGYGDVEAVTRRDGLVEVGFANGDVVELDATALGVTGEFTVDIAEGGAAVLVETLTGEREIDWMVVRSAADPAFAQALRERDAEEARRIGRRLRALRENRGMSQKAVASVVGMSAPQLAKLEQGETDMRISTLRSLLRALGASFADIAGPDAPEVSVKELAKRAQRAGAPSDVVKRIVVAVDPRRVPELISRAFGWDPANILADRLVPPALAAPVKLKRRGVVADEGTGLLVLAESLARRSALAYRGEPGVVPGDPAALRRAILGDATQMTLEALVRWCWDAGVLVVPMQAKGGFGASAWLVGEQPVVVIKEAPDYKARWLFVLAHELGHVAHGHVTDGAVVDVEKVWAGGDDAEEAQANAYALDLLVPGHHEMLDEIRRRSEGPDAHRKFKFKAIDVARARGFSETLVLLVAAFGLLEVAEDKDRWGSANNEAKKEGSARAVVAKEFARSLDLEQLDRLDVALIQAVALG